jgi:hypothetical protein
MIWTGRVLSAIPVLMLCFGATLSLFHPEKVAEGMTRYGYTQDKLILIVVLEFGCALLYAIPQTAFFGAILMTAYFGGAVATHVRVSDPGYGAAILMAIFTWAGLYLRDARLRALVPLRRKDD